MVGPGLPTASLPPAGCPGFEAGGAIDGAVVDFGGGGGGIILHAVYSAVLRLVL
jgi:hypothetical protein